MPLTNTDLLAIYRESTTTAHKLTIDELKDFVADDFEVPSSETPPTSAEAGDLWFNETDARLYYYYNDGNTEQWVDANPAGSGGGSSDVESVNGKTGAVVLSASDVGAATTAQGATADTATQPGDNISTFTNDANYLAAGDDISELNNDAGYLVTGDDISELNNDAGYITSTEADALPYVETTGDNMSGNLTLGTDKITLDASDGSAEFAGTVTAENFVANQNVKVNNNLAVVSSAGNLYEGYQGSDDAENLTFSVLADGSALF